MAENSSGNKTGLTWRWLIVLAAFFAMFGFYGTSGSFGLFVKPLEEALGISRVAASAAMSIFMGTHGILGVFTGRLTDKYGARVIIGIGAVLGAVGYFLMSLVDNLWQLHLYFGVFAGLSMGTSFTPIVATVSKWFSDKRVMMVGLTTVGIAVGQMIIPPIAALFMADYGWRSAYILLAIILFVTTIPSMLWLKKKTATDNGAHLHGQSVKIPANDGAVQSERSDEWSARDAIRTKPFWMFAIVGFVTAAGFYIVIVHLIAYAIDSGIQPPSAALILTFLNGGLIIAQLLVWLIARKISSRYSIMLLLSVQALALFLLMGAGGFTALISLGFLYGFGFGGSNTLRLSMVSEIFGTRSSGAILGLVSVAWCIGGICGPILAGYIFDISQSYDVAFLIGGLFLAIGASSAFFLRRPVR